MGSIPPWGIQDHLKTSCALTCRSTGERIAALQTPTTAVTMAVVTRINHGCDLHLRVSPVWLSPGYIRSGVREGQDLHPRPPGAGDLAVYPSENLGSPQPRTDHRTRQAQSTGPGQAGHAEGGSDRGTHVAGYGRLPTLPAGEFC